MDLPTITAGPPTGTGGAPLDSVSYSSAPEKHN